MNKSIVGICCYADGAYSLFKNAWESTGCRPDGVFKDEDTYYIVWNNILWDDVINKKTAPLFDIMDYLDDVSAFGTSSGFTNIIRYIKGLIPVAKAAADEDLEYGYESDSECVYTYINSNPDRYMYACIELCDTNNVYTRGDEEIGFEFEWKLCIPDSAKPCNIDGETVEYAVIRSVDQGRYVNDANESANDDKSIVRIFRKESDALSFVNQMSFRNDGNRYFVKPVPVE